MFEQDIFNYFSAFLAAVSDPSLILLIFIGVVLGLIVGILPGLGPPATIALLFPITYTLEPVSAISLLAGIFYGAKYGGAFTAILLGIPGETDALATMQAGYSFTKQGKSTEALFLANIASFFGSIFAIILILLLSPFLSAIAVYFGSLAKFLLICFMLCVMCIFSGGRVYKNFIMLLLGLILANIGVDAIYGTQRLTFGVLWEGIDLTALLLGFFGIAEVCFLVTNKATKLVEVQANGIQKFSALNCFFAMLRASSIGFITGIIPSGAGVTASLTAYSLEKKLAKKEDKNKSLWTALAASESANNASAIASFAPLLLLGLPTNPIMAALLATLTISGISPEYQIQTNQADFFWSIMSCLTIGNIIVIVLALLLCIIWKKNKITKLTSLSLYAVIIILCLFASYQSTGTMFGVVQCLIFSCFAYILRLRNYNLAPLIIAFVLGTRLESYLIQTLLAL